MKYIVSDGYLKYHNEETGYVQNVTNDIYCGGLGQIYKLEQDCDIMYIVYKDDKFVAKYKNFQSGTIILVTPNSDVIDVADGNKTVEYITKTVDARLQMRRKAAEQSEVGCNDSCAG